MADRVRYTVSLSVGYMKSILTMTMNVAVVSAISLYVIHVFLCSMGKSLPDGFSRQTNRIMSVIGMHSNSRHIYMLCGSDNAAIIKMVPMMNASPVMVKLVKFCFCDFIKPLSRKSTILTVTVYSVKFHIGLPVVPNGMHTIEANVMKGGRTIAGFAIFIMVTDICLFNVSFNKVRPPHVCM